MFPWLWFWAPNLHLEFPWSGDVTQDIDPVASWFFGTIKPGAGNPRIERRAFDVASYGRQLGWITEVLIAIAERDGAPSGQAGASLEKLKRIRGEIEKIKDAEYDAELQRVERSVAAIRGRGGARARTLDQQLRALPPQKNP